MEGNYQRLPIAIVYQEKAAFKDTYAGAVNVSLDWLKEEDLI
jgi:hypothetical protein